VFELIIVVFIIIRFSAAPCAMYRNRWKVTSCLKSCVLLLSRFKSALFPQKQTRMTWVPRF